jgi:hypothetical protein
MAIYEDPKKDNTLTKRMTNKLHYIKEIVNKINDLIVHQCLIKSLGH